MRSAVMEFYKRFHGIENINEDMQIDIDCMESFLYTVFNIYDDSVRYWHEIELNSRVQDSVRVKLSNGGSDSFKR